MHSDRLFIHGRVGDEPVLYNPAPGGDQPQPALRRFAYTENVRTARQTQRDYVLQGTDRILIRGPAGTVILDSNGICLDAPNILLKGNVKVVSPGSNQVKAIEAAIREGSPLIEECPLDKGDGS